MQSWQLQLELQWKQKQKPQGRGILSESLPPGEAGGAPTPAKKSLHKEHVNSYMC